MDMNEYDMNEFIKEKLDSMGPEALRQELVELFQMITSQSLIFNKGSSEEIFKDLGLLIAFAKAYSSADEFIKKNIECGESMLKEKYILKRFNKTKL